MCLWQVGCCDVFCTLRSAGCFYTHVKLYHNGFKNSSSKNRIHIPIQFRYALSADLHWQWRVQSCGRLTGPPFLARLGGMRQKMMDIESLRPRGVVSVPTFQQIGRARVIFFWLLGYFFAQRTPCQEVFGNVGVTIGPFLGGCLVKISKFVGWVAPYLESLKQIRPRLISGRVYWDLYDMGIFRQQCVWFKKDGLPSTQWVEIIPVTT